MSNNDSCAAEISQLRAELELLTRPARVLFVEDDRGTQASYRALTKDFNCTTEYASTLEEGRRMAFSGDFDLIFIDIRMPDGNGLDLFAQIRKARLRASLVILSGFIDNDTAERIAVIGFAPIAMKPVSFNEEYFDWMMPTFNVRKKQLKERNDPAL